MLRFKSFIKEQENVNAHIGYTADLYLHPSKPPIVYIFKKGVPLDEGAKNWKLTTVTSKDPHDKTKTGRVRELTKDNAPEIPKDHHLEAFKGFTPSEDLLNNHDELMKAFHKHLAAHGLYSATDKHPMHKTPHMQKFEDGVHDILGGGKHERWHTDSNGALGSPGSFAPRDAAVYSSSDASTHVGKLTGNMVKNSKGKHVPEVEPLSPGTKPGTVHIFDDYGEKIPGSETKDKHGNPIPGTEKGDSQHKAPNREERGTCHFIRASDIREIPKEGIPKKSGGYYDHNTKEGMDEYIKDKTPANERNNMHNKLHNKIGKWISDNPSPEKGSEKYEQRQKLLEHINSPENKPHYNHNDWVEKHIKRVDSKTDT